MIYHGHLKIFWEKETIEYMKNKKCPIPSDELTSHRTWFEHLIKIEKVEIMQGSATDTATPCWAIARS
jgi:hypothetical protein